jgi:ribonuclease D
MNKDYQVSEWRIRPIPSSMIDYARRDSLVLPFLARAILTLLPEERLKEMLLGGCKQAKRNRKGSQPLIRSIQAVTI